MDLRKDILNVYINPCASHVAQTRMKPHQKMAREIREGKSQVTKEKRGSLGNRACARLFFGGRVLLTSEGVSETERVDWGNALLKRKSQERGEKDWCFLQREGRNA